MAGGRGGWIMGTGPSVDIQYCWIIATVLQFDFYMCDNINKKCRFAPQRLSENLSGFSLPTKNS